jgi:glutamate-1-semialdehyde 2,1-aminomutase
MQRPNSAALFERSKRRLPGGVNSPVRACGGVGGTPVFMAKGEGPFLFDVDGHRYLDYVGSWGPLLLGHAHPAVVAAIQEAATRGTSFGCPTALELEMAEELCAAVESLEVVRLVSSGTEATMSAIRLARGFTGRPRIVKLEGCYHGHGDALLAKAGSGVATFGLPDTPGVPPDTVRDTLTVPYNDLDALRATVEASADALAAVIIEPVAGNMGCIPPREGYLEGVRALCDEVGALLVFDEVMTGFRVAWEGAQGRYGVRPDLTTLGKVIGGGLPVGAYGGREDIMRRIAPDGPIYQAGTLSGNPLAMTAGLTTLREIKRLDGLYARLERLGRRLVDGLVALAAERGIALTGCAVGSMFGVFFSHEPVHDYAGAKAADTAAHARFFHGMLDRGVYLAPSAFEAGFLSALHDEALIDQTLAHAAGALDDVAAR